eukprot:4290129-Prymnesium_polylepis.1
MAGARPPRRLKALQRPTTLARRLRPQGCWTNASRSWSAQLVHRCSCRVWRGNGRRWSAGLTLAIFV